MPISGLGSWLITIDEFLAHWLAVDAALAPGFLELLAGYKRGNLVTNRATLAANFTEVQNKDNTLQNASGDRDVKRALIRPRMLQFGPAVRGTVPGSLYVGSVPRTPPFSAAPSIWRDRMDDMKGLWATINTNAPPVTGFTPPLLLAAAYAQTTFVTESGVLSTAFIAHNTADQDAQLARAARDATFGLIYPRLLQYRQKVLGSFAANDPLVVTLPRLTPPPGSTPARVNLSGIWDPGIEMGHLVWTESTRPDLAEYPIRYHPGPKYKASEEQFVDSVPPGTLEFDTTFGLVAPGSVAWFKVYVVTDTGNEKGSNAVKITRT